MLGPVTLVLGLGRGVGIACARRFAEAGHRVLVADSNETRMQKAENELGGRVVFHHGELHTRLGVKNVFAATLEAYDVADNIVVIPPLFSPESLADIEFETFDKGLAKTARAAVMTLKLFDEHVAERETTPGSGIERSRQRGTATFVLGLSALLADPGRFTEAFTQAAVLGAVRAGAVELAGSGIRCNAISAVRPRAEDDEPWLRQRTPLRSAALADEIADAAFYLASPAAAIVTGANLILDGGRTALGGVMPD
ncbi:MAG: SDR family oxidoreductase [Pseudomonadota bacterium]